MLHALDSQGRQRQRLAQEQTPKDKQQAVPRSEAPAGTAAGAKARAV